MKIKPLKYYKEPQYQPREIVGYKPSLLVDYVPSLWKSKNVVMSALTTFILSGYLQSEPVKTTLKYSQGQIETDGNQKIIDSTSEKEIQKKQMVSIAPLFIHGEGRGADGCVVISPPLFLSEEEARQIIETELKKENFIFDKKDMVLEDPAFEIKFKRYAINKEKRILEEKGEEISRKFILDGYCSEYNLGYEFISHKDCLELKGLEFVFSVQEYDTKKTAEDLSEKMRKYGKINTVVFYDPLFLWKSAMYDVDEINKLADRERLKATTHNSTDETSKSLKANTAELDKVGKSSISRNRNNAREDLLAQVRDFISWIKKEELLKNVSKK